VIWVLLTFTFLMVNMTFLIYKSSRSLLLTRLLILEIMFLLMAVFLSVCILVTYTTRYGRALSEVQVGKCDYITLFYTLTFINHNNVDNKKAVSFHLLILLCHVKYFNAPSLTFKGSNFPALQSANVVKGY